MKNPLFVCSEFVIVELNILSLPTRNTKIQSTFCAIRIEFIRKIRLKWPKSLQGSISKLHFFFAKTQNYTIITFKMPKMEFKFKYT